MTSTIDLIGPHCHPSWLSATGGIAAGINPRNIPLYTRRKQSTLVGVDNGLQPPSASASLPRIQRPPSTPISAKPSSLVNGTGSNHVGGTFPVTQWSMILEASTATTTQAHDALQSLCQRYWYPLYHFIRRQGRDHHEAQDCTQEFLSQLLAADGLQRARPERGRFRTFLLSSLSNFLTSEWRRACAAKRGGGVVSVPFGIPGPDERFCAEPQDTGLTPEQAFDQSWALAMIDRALTDVRVEYARGGRNAVFEALAPLIWGNASSESLAQQAAQHGMAPQTFTVALHRARRRVGDRLRAIVAETVADPKDIDAELRNLVQAVSETSARS